jgi:hypothetical protein
VLLKRVTKEDSEKYSRIKGIGKNMTIIASWDPLLDLGPQKGIGQGNGEM